MHTAEFFRYFVFMTLQCDANHEVWLHGMMHTAESDSAVKCTPWSFFRYFVFMTLLCDEHRGVWLRCMMHTTKSDSAENAHRGDMMHTAESDSAVCAHGRVLLHGMIHTAEFIKNLNILVKSKPNSKILYPVYQGPRWVWIMKKAVKNLVTHSL